MPKIISTLIKGVGSGIGLATEAIEDHKQKKATSRGVSPNPQAEQSISHSASKHEEVGLHDNGDSSSDDEHLDSDKAAWALDDAATGVDDLPTYSEYGASLNEVDPKPMDHDFARDFMQLHPQSSPLPAPQRLPMPVILPQRRPKDKSRGFVRAYAPLLGPSGIDEKTFIDFLNQLDIAAKASPVFDVINVACFAVGLVPNPIAMGVTIAVQTVSRSAQEMQTRDRRNTFLDQINADLFMPKALFCMIMTFKPDSPYDPVLQSNIITQGTDAGLIKATSTPDNALRQKLKSLRLASGVTKGELSLPESAPLVYPALDKAAVDAIDAGQVLPEHKQSGLKSSFVASYFDRRAQASYAGLHPGSALARAAPPPEKQFASRFSDPNHPANSGTILGLLTGGKFDPAADKRGRKAQRRARKEGRILSQEELYNAKMGRAPTRKQGIIKRVLQKDVLYLIVTNLPSESEMAEIRQELERVKNETSHGGNGIWSYGQGQHPGYEVR
jgi:hypothetical protein